MCSIGTCRKASTRRTQGNLVASMLWLWGCDTRKWMAAEQRCGSAPSPKQHWLDNHSSQVAQQKAYLHINIVVRFHPLERHTRIRRDAPVALLEIKKINVVTLELQTIIRAALRILGFGVIVITYPVVWQSNSELLQRSQPD